MAEGVTAKLIRRHPHVFGDDAASSAGEVKHRWEARKRTHEDRQGIFHDVPAVLPGLQYAAKIQRRAVSVGFEYPTAAGAFEDLNRELAELREEVESRTAPAPELPADPDVAGELGDLLFAAVNVSRRWNTDPELAVRAAAEPLPRPRRARRGPRGRRRSGLRRCRAGRAGGLLSGRQARAPRA